MKRALLLLTVLAGGCSQAAAPPLPVPPPPGDTTLSVLEPDGATKCVWKRVEPGAARVLCRIDQPCDAVTVRFTTDGANAFATGETEMLGGRRWICPASDAVRTSQPLPPGAESEGAVGFDENGSIVLVWDERRLPSLRDRIVARLTRAPPPTPVYRAHSEHLVSTGWSKDSTAQEQLASAIEDASVMFGQRMNATVPDARLARLVSESLPAIHPTVDWRSLMTKPGLAFLASDGDAFHGPLVFVLRGDDARVAPETPGESDDVLEQVHGSLVLLQTTGRLGPTSPRLWDAATGELLWSDPKATRAVFWPKP